MSTNLIHKLFIMFSMVLLVFVIGCQEDTPNLPDEPDKPIVNPNDSVPNDSTEMKDTVEVKSFPFHAIAGRLDIRTENNAPIRNKIDYVNCTVDISHENSEWCKSGMTGGIRGRGNSTWLWYDKKPYRIKFDSKEEMLGLPKAKSWVLLAEYRDPTHLMNAFVFELGQLMGMPATNHNRWVEVTLNGKNIGLYHLTEQVQQNKNRVNIDEKTGYLISLDKDDGPELAGNQPDNFFSSVYRLPVCIKCPDDAAAVKENVREELRKLEQAIKDCDYELVKSLLDVDTMIDFLIIQELIYNVELDAPRSMYMHKDIDTKWKMGPLWDFDAGFDFDWGNMYDGHGYFESTRELVLGISPATHGGANYRIPDFFSDLFKNKEFVTSFKNRFKELTPLVEQAWTNTIVYYDANEDLWAADLKMWPIHPKYTTEINRMHTWIANRLIYLNNIVAKY